MKKLILSLMVIGSSTLAFCQADFRSGYIVTNDADTVQGLIAYQEGSRVHRSCSFKALANDEPTTYLPDKIKGYGFRGDKAFESWQIDIKDQKTEMAFLEVIVSGLVSLYEMDRTFWVNKEGQQIHPLINTAKLTGGDGNQVIRYRNEYTGTLNMLLFDCPELRPQIGKATLTEKSLTRLITAYNRCMGAPVVVHKTQRPWMQFSPSLTTGLNLSQITFEPDGSNQHLVDAFVLSKSLAIGLSTHAWSPRLSERLAFHIDLLYLRTRYHGYQLLDYSSSTRRNYTTIEIHQLKLPVGFRYAFSKRNLTPHVMAGISNTLHLRSRSRWITEWETDNIVDTFSNPALTINNNQPGIWAGFGVTKSINDRFDVWLDLRYEQTKGIVGSISSVNKNTFSKIRNFQMLIGFRTK